MVPYMGAAKIFSRQLPLILRFFGCTCMTGPLKNLSITRECIGSMRESSLTPFNVRRTEMWRSREMFLSEETANT